MQPISIPLFDVWGWIFPVFLICLVIVGLFAWPFTRGSNRARLAVSGPYLFHDGKYINSNHYRMSVRNRSAAVAKDVRINLCSMPRPPRSPAWQADYPYPIIQVGHTLNSNDCHINKNDDAKFEIVHGWANEDGMLFVEIDTKSGGRNPITIERREHWELDYIVTAANADPAKFTLEVYVDNDAVIAKRKNRSNVTR